MANIGEMNKEQVEEMLNKRAEIALASDGLEKMYPDVFCGVLLDYENTLHIYKTEDFRKIAKILEKEIMIKPYDEVERKKLTNLGEMGFYYEYSGKRWRVFTLYSDEREVIG